MPQLAVAQIRVSTLLVRDALSFPTRCHPGPQFSSFARPLPTNFSTTRIGTVQLGLDDALDAAAGAAPTVTQLENLT